MLQAKHNFLHQTHWCNHHPPLLRDLVVTCTRSLFACKEAQEERWHSTARATNDAEPRSQVHPPSLSHYNQKISFSHPQHLPEKIAVNRDVPCLYHPLALAETPLLINKTRYRCPQNKLKWGDGLFWYKGITQASGYIWCFDVGKRSRFLWDYTKQFDVWRRHLCSVEFALNMVQ